MIRWVQLATAKAPGGVDELKLMQRGTEFSIMLGTNELMNSRLYGSEEALAVLSAERCANKTNPHILIGGLGMGFTLRAALNRLTANAKITVVELVPEIIAWARVHLRDIFGTSLDDPRVGIKCADVAAEISASTSVFDAILLDVDNGPDGLTRSANDQLYSSKGLARAKAALRTGGILAVWSSGPDSAFTQRLGNAGFLVEEIVVRANGKKGGARHVIWFAKKR